MKSKNAVLPALLSKETESKVWVIDIDMGNGTKTKMQFTDKTQAQTEFNRHRQMGIFAGRWITEITINEQNNQLK